MTENYKLFNLTENATDEEITARYEELKAKYSEDRWLDGEEGNEAARMLTKINVAYKEIMSERKESKQNTEGQNAFEEITALLKNNDLAKAQDMLDAFNERNAEWHYLQAVIYYKKNWTNDSKKQLEIAMQMDPDNVKYKNAYGKMNAKNEYQKQSAGNTQNPYSNPSAQGDYDDQMGGNACCECCQAYMCANCLMNCCCGCR